MTENSPDILQQARQRAAALRQDLQAYHADLIGDATAGAPAVGTSLLAAIAATAALEAALRPENPSAAASRPGEETSA
jgi:hypothetical protein